MKVLTIFGTRPEAVKMVPVVKAFQREPEVETIVCVTAQHREMLDQVLDLFKIRPDYDLNIMQVNQNLSALTARILDHLSPIIESIRPDWIIAQGDTTTVMVASLLAYYHHIYFGHVEAGLRTDNKWEPFPEELNRRIAGVSADLHFAPTEYSRQNLLKENVPDWRILVTGNPVIDALHEIAAQPIDDFTRNIFTQLNLNEKKRLVLMTAHRRENFGSPLRSIFTAVQQLASEFSEEIEIVYPVHLNPNVQQPAHEMLSGIPNIHLLEPMPYLTMVNLQKRASLVLTDSGGIQEEATALGIPTLVLRNVTERPEGVEAGMLTLVGSDPDTIIAAASAALKNNTPTLQSSRQSNPFGDGHAAEKIVRGVLNFKDRTIEPT